MPRIKVQEKKRISFVPNCNEVFQLNEGLRKTEFKLIALTGIETKQ